MSRRRTQGPPACVVGGVELVRAPGAGGISSAVVAAPGSPPRLHGVRWFAPKPDLASARETGIFPARFGRRVLGGR